MWWWPLWCPSRWGWCVVLWCGGWCSREFGGGLRCAVCVVVGGAAFSACSFPVLKQDHRIVTWESHGEADVSKSSRWRTGRAISARSAADPCLVLKKAAVLSESQGKQPRTKGLPVAHRRARPPSCAVPSQADPVKARPTVSPFCILRTRGDSSRANLGELDRAVPCSAEAPPS